MTQTNENNILRKIFLAAYARQDHETMDWCLQILQLKAEKGDAKDALRLGNAYSYFEGNDAIENAKKWYRQAADHGEADGYTELGFLAEQAGREETAALYFQLAAEKGERRAQESLGDFYFTGVGVKVDYDLAKKWYLEAGPSDVECIKRLAWIEHWEKADAEEKERMEQELNENGRILDGSTIKLETFS